LSKQAEAEALWQLKESPEYQEGLKDRYKLEKKFGEANKWHGFAESQFE